MNGPITYEMLSAVIASIFVVGGAWLFIERRIVGVEKDARATIELLERETKIDIKACMAEGVLLREKMYREFVQNDQLIRLEERLVGAINELRRALQKQWEKGTHQ